MTVFIDYQQHFLQTKIHFFFCMIYLQLTWTEGVVNIPIRQNLIWITIIRQWIYCSIKKKKRINYMK